MIWSVSGVCLILTDVVSMPYINRIMKTKKRNLQWLRFFVFGRLPFVWVLPISS
jgi:hypothetical protein